MLSTTSLKRLCGAIGDHTITEKRVVMKLLALRWVLINGFFWSPGEGQVGGYSLRRRRAAKRLQSTGTRTFLLYYGEGKVS